MAVYLIDYENVNKDGLNGVSKLTEKDRVIIFYSAKADRMTFGLHRRLNETLATVEYKRVDVGGHNALDFQLATYLGFLLAKDSSEEYCIVSNDRGYEYLAGFWRRPLYNVTRTREIATSPQAEERRQQKKQIMEEKEDFFIRRGGDESGGADGGQLLQRTGERVEVSEESERTDLLVIEPLPDSITAWAEEAVPANPGKPVFQTASGNPETQEAQTGAADRSESKSPADPSDQEAAAAEPAPADSRRRSGRNQKRSRRGEKPSGDPQSRKLTDSVEECVSGLDLEESDRSRIADYIERYKTKLGLNNALVRQFGTQKAGEIYKMIKPLIWDKKGSVEEKKPSQEEKKLAEDVKKMTAGIDLTEEDLKEITSYVQRYKTKQGVNNALVRRFRSQKAGEIYKVIKPLLKEKKGRNSQ